MEPDMRRAVLSAIEGGYQLENWEQDLVDCPACGNPALASGTYEVNWDVDVDHDDFGQPFLVGAEPTVTFFAGHLECRACGLGLDGLEELRAAGLASSWEMEGIDTGTLLAEYNQQWEGFEP
jgi:hypothetical protein